MTTLYWSLESQVEKFDKSIYHFRTISLYEKLSEKEFLKQTFPSCFTNPEHEEVIFRFLSDWVGLNLNRHLLHESFISTEYTISMKIKQGINIIRMKYDNDLSEKMMLGVVEERNTNNNTSSSSSLFKSTTLPVERTTYEDIDFSDEMTKTDNTGDTSNQSLSVRYNYTPNFQSQIEELYKGFVRELDTAVFSQFLF